MTKTQLAKLRSILTKVNRGILRLEKRLEAIEGSQRLVESLVSVLDQDVRNLFHVVAETQTQQRKLSLVPNNEKTKLTPRSPRRDR